MATFSHIVADPNSQTPSNLSLSLSAQNNGIIITGSAPLSADPKPIGLLYTLIPSASSASITTSVGGLPFKIATGYNTTVLAVLYDNGSSAPFTLNTSLSAQASLSAAGYNSSPEQRRKRLLGYI